MKRIDSVTKLSRQLNYALTPKAGQFLERKPYPPGQHGSAKRRPAKMTDFKRHLMEKQHLRAIYNVHERQMRNYVGKAIQMHGNPVDNLVQILESRLDATAHRAGFGRTIYAIRQYVAHGHIMVNKKPVNIPSYLLKVGDVVSVKPASHKLAVFETAREEMVGAMPAYISRSTEPMTAQLTHLPTRDEVPIPVELSLVIEYYSK